jgi:diguanylate cyclase (GGDEF)-like protein
MTSVEKFLSNDVRLPSPPAIAVRILDAVKHNVFSFSHLGSIIQSDPALAGRILRLANSQLYSLPRKVNTIEMALAVLGMNALKNIALSFTLSQIFQGHRGERFDFDRLWRRSITAAVAAQLISREIGFKSDECFIAALLQDVGIGAMFMIARDPYLAVLDEKVATGSPVTVVEAQIFGFDHQETGAELLKMWGLPESVYMPIRYHHDPENAPLENKPLCRVLQAADRLSAVYHGSGSVKNIEKAKQLLEKQFGLDEQKVDRLIDNVAEKSIELISQFNIDPGQLKPFSQILQEANEELGRLNLSYEMLIMAHREARQKVNWLAAELKTANEKLREAVYRDSLTTVYNHRYFQESLARELERAGRYSRPLSLIMLDIDRFKSVNDEYGHQVGDTVLKTIALLLVKNSRGSDVVARYGGEEFVIILPETTLAGAATKGEVCRSALEKTEISIGAKSIHATVSVGVATSEPNQTLSRDELIRAADRALYRSKNEGKNRVTLWSEPASG